MSTSEKRLRVLQGGQKAAQLPDLDDDDLMLLAHGGRQDAFEILIKRHQTMVLGCATRFFSDRQIAREIAQDVFLALWAERTRYRARGRFKSFVVTMTFNRCRVVARQRKSHLSKLERVGRDSSPIADDQTPLDVLLEASRNKVVRDKLAEIPEGAREVLILRYQQDMTLKEVADSLDKPMGTVKSLMFRGLKKLQAKLVEEAT